MSPTSGDRSSISLPDDVQGLDAIETETVRLTEAGLTVLIDKRRLSNAIPSPPEEEAAAIARWLIRFAKERGLRYILSDGDIGLWKE